MAYEFSVALRASCALLLGVMLAAGIPPDVGNYLAALRAAEIYVLSHAREGTPVPAVERWDNQYRFGYGW
jgi:hypothetical protein